MSAAYVTGKRRELRIEAVEASTCFLWHVVHDRRTNDCPAETLWAQGRNGDLDGGEPVLGTEALRTAAKEERRDMEDLPEGLASSNAGRIAQRLGEISAGKVLDVGTSSGGLISTLMKTLKAYDSFVGIDYCPSDQSKKDMESARKRLEGKPVQFLEMNAENLQFEDESFDTVCISWSLHHLANIDKVMAEMKRVLKTGGNFILQEMYCDGEQTEAQKAGEIEHEWEARIDSLLGITHNKALTRQRIGDIARGLRLTETEIFDSTHLVNCLSCERKHECEDPRNQATSHEAAKDIDNVIKRIENYPDLETRRRLVEEGERIKEAITASGSSPTSYLFVIGKK